MKAPSCWRLAKKKAVAFSRKSSSLEKNSSVDEVGGMGSLGTGTSCCPWSPDLLSPHLLQTLPCSCPPWTLDHLLPSGVSPPNLLASS